MAEYVKWRFTKMRAGVTMALFGLLAGLGIRSAEQSPAPAKTVAVDRASQKSLPKGVIVPHNVIGSAQVKLHSLTLADIKVHEVASYSALIGLLKKFDTTNDALLKLDTALNKVETADAAFLKIDDANAQFLKVDAAAASFLKIDGTAQNALKIDGLSSSQIVQGHGSVMTGQLVAGPTDAPLVTIPGLLTVNGGLAVGGGPQVTLLNQSGHTLLVNDGTRTSSLGDGLLLPAVQTGDGSVKVLQIVVQGGTQAITLNVSSFLNGNTHTLVGQALVGTP
jgi:hypothetical protein